MCVVANQSGLQIAVVAATAFLHRKHGLSLLKVFLLKLHCSFSKYLRKQAKFSHFFLKLYHVSSV